eukprot:scaffold4069_cov85-Cyclotella_meneghiniana.AAC.16
MLLGSSGRNEQGRGGILGGSLLPDVSSTSTSQLPHFTLLLSPFSSFESRGVRCDVRCWRCEVAVAKSLGYRFPPPKNVTVRPHNFTTFHNTTHHLTTHHLTSHNLFTAKQSWESKEGNREENMPHDYEQ